MDRGQKNDLIQILKQKCTDYSVVIAAHYAGLSVKDVSNLRNILREKGIFVKVAKNKLAKIAFNNTSQEVLCDVLQGPVILFFSSDPVDITKILSEFSAKNKKLVIQGGVLDGSFLTKENIATLSKLPSMDQLRSKIISVIQAPSQRIAQVSSAPAAQIARLIGQYNSNNH